MSLTCFHNHLMPAVDDGAKDKEFSAAALAAYRREGVTQVITTPHFLGSLTHNDEWIARRLEELDGGWAALREVAEADALQFGSAIRLERGVEVMLDVPDPNLSDPRVRLAGTKYVLVEFPMLQLPPVNAAIAVGMLRRDGWQPVIAHPERYRNLESMTPLGEFLTAGALLQVNAGSLFGDYGAKAQTRAQEILAEGYASFVCADYHARGEPGLRRFADTLSQAGFAEQANLLLSVNNGRILTGEPILPVPPILTQRREAAPWWRRLFVD